MKSYFSSLPAFATLVKLPGLGHWKLRRAGGREPKYKPLSDPNPERRTGAADGGARSSVSKLSIVWLLGCLGGAARRAEP